MDDYLLSRQTFSAQKLMEAHPPKWHHPYKRLIARLSCPDDAMHGGKLTFSRWRAMPLPEEYPDAVPEIEAHPNFFTYERSGLGEWHLNFADRNLFGYYAGPLFAQDEMQVTEHPALAALREALNAQKVVCDTEDNDSPTPVLVQNVERRCAIDSRGIYGNAFARAEAGTIQRATCVLEPPTLSNILAIAAPSGSFGVYSRTDLKYVLTTAYTGFAAVRLASAMNPVTIHTGFWGCGAFGGNRTLMVALQILAARLAGIHKIVFHTGDDAGLTTIGTVRSLIDEMGDSFVSGHLESIYTRSFRWGVSDGN